MSNSSKMMSMHEGSLYEDQGVGPFHKPSRLDYGHLKEGNSNKLLFPNASDVGLSTPEVTNLLTSVESSLITSQAPTPTRFIRGAAGVTTEQEMYARGFLEALDELRSGNRQPEAMAPTELKIGSGSSRRMNAGLSRSAVHHSSQDLASSSHFISGPNPSLEAVAPTYVTATMDYIPNIAPPSHSEPSSVYASSHSFAPNTYTPQVHFAPMLDYNSFSSSQPPVSDVLPTQMMKELQRVVPADIKTQEQMKVERKKARNRIAASKCRQRRLVRESDLQGKVRILKEHNHELNNEVTGLKLQINNLKKALIQHMKGGCQVNLPDGYGLRSDSSSSE